MSLARNSDPITSHLAAARVHEFALSHQEQIVSCLIEFGPMTCDEISNRIGMFSHQINKRVVELERKGLARPTGETRTSASGRQSRVWGAL